jgi:hypothetical protein
MTRGKSGHSGAARLGVAAALALGLLVSPLQTVAQTRLTVSATILKRASLKVLAQPSAVEVTAADIARGFVDVPTAATIAIRSNSQAGFQFEFASVGEFVRGLEVRGLGGNVQLGPEGGFVHQVAGPAIETILNLGIRFDLTADARAGVYAWPLRMAVTPM